MKIVIQLIKLFVTLVAFVAVYWLLNVIWGEGNGFTTLDALGAVGAGSIFYAVFNVIPYFYTKLKRNRRL